MRFLNRIHPASAAGGLIVGLAVALAMPAFAQLSSMNTFQSGETASASEVNENFDALVQAVNDLEQQVGDLQAEVDAHEALFDLQDFVVDLDEFIEVHFSSPTDTAVEGPIIRVTGANFQIVNASGQQTTPDGTGNLVVGFSRARGSFTVGELCSDGAHDNQADCETAGHEWGVAHNSGSHNIVGGFRPAYSQTGGLVMGSNSAINRREATVTGGIENTASGVQSSVSGGRQNEASGNRSSVTGGRLNEASDFNSSVSGGIRNRARAGGSSISGGGTITGAGCTIDLESGWGATDEGGETDFGGC